MSGSGTLPKTDAAVTCALRRRDRTQAGPVYSAPLPAAQHGQPCVAPRAPAASKSPGASRPGAVEIIDEVVDLLVDLFDCDETFLFSFGLRRGERGVKRGARLFLALQQNDRGRHDGGQIGEAIASSANCSSSGGKVTVSMRPLQ